MSKTVDDRLQVKNPTNDQKLSDPLFLHFLSYTKDIDAIGESSDVWEGNIRILRKSINGAS